MALIPCKLCGDEQELVVQNLYDYCKRCANKIVNIIEDFHPKELEKVIQHLKKREKL